MKEYKVLVFALNQGQQPIENKINELAKDGWQFIGSHTFAANHYSIIIFLERFKTI